ncbi:MAG: sugar ABC transporter permease [Gammaproteobacteria bacterium]|nr:sugar ABC transporter permease [Gammaproteobacteria bacterium]
MSGRAELIDWVVPAEVRTLRRWLPAAAVVLAIAAALEGLRYDGPRQTGLLCGLLLLAGCRACLAGDRRTWKRRLGATFAGAGTVIAAHLLVVGGKSLYELWTLAWLALPSVLALYWLISPRVAAWASGTDDAVFIAECLSSNRRLGPLLSRAGTQALLIHACAPVVIPLVWIADVAVSPGNVLGGAIGDAFTLDHFAAVLSSDAFGTWVGNSLAVSVGTTIVGLLLAIPAGYAFSRYRFAGRRASMFLFVLVQMFPGIIILLPYFMIMKTLGLLNTSIGLIIVYSVTALPLCVWMLKGFFDSIPREVEEAAAIEGCTQLEIFRHIILPLSLPAVAVTALFSFLTAWNEFLLALVFNTSNDQYTLPVGLASMIPATGQQWGDFAAASILVSIPVVILFIAFQRALVQGLSAGAVKG